MITWRIPILGQVSAGKPVEWLPIVSYRSVRSVVGCDPAKVVAIQVVGCSLINDSILDGDWAIVNLTHQAQVGNLVVALTPGGLTIKYYYPQQDGTIALVPANDEIETMIFDAPDVIVRGVVRRIERDM